MRRADKRPRCRPAFTLIELVVALALSGLVMLGAARLLDQLADARDRTSRDAVQQAERMNGLRLLRALVYRAEAGSDSTLRFTGHDSEATFASWCEVPAGWLERCVVTLRAGVGADSAAIVATFGAGSPLRLWRGNGTPAFRYFGATTAAGQWWRGWGTSVALPAAIGVVIQDDTLVLRVGAGV